MLQKIVNFLIIFFAAVLEVSFWPVFFPKNVVPEILLVLVIFWVIRDGFEKNWGKIIGAGFLADLVSFQITGWHILSFTLTAFAISYLAKRFLVTHKTWGFLVMLALTAAGTVLNAFWLLIIERATLFFAKEGASIVFYPIEYKIVFAKALLNAGSFCLIYWPMKKMDKFLDLYNRRQYSFK